MNRGKIHTKVFFAVFRLEMAKLSAAPKGPADIFFRCIAAVPALAASSMLLLFSVIVRSYLSALARAEAFGRWIHGRQLSHHRFYKVFWTPHPVHTACTRQSRPQTLWCHRFLAAELCTGRRGTWQIAGFCYQQFRFR